MKHESFAFRMYSPWIGNLTYPECGCGRQLTSDDISDTVQTEYGTRYFALYHENFGFVCEKCFNNIPIASVCRHCQTHFESRNLLFKHLTATNHYK